MALQDAEGEEVYEGLEEGGGAVAEPMSNAGWAHPTGRSPGPAAAGQVAAVPPTWYETTMPVSSAAAQKASQDGMYIS